MRALNKTYPFEVWAGTLAGAPVLILLVVVLFDLAGIALNLSLVMMPPIIGYSVICSLPILALLVLFYWYAGRKNIPSFWIKTILSLIAAVGSFLLFYLAFYKTYPEFLQTSYLIFPVCYVLCFTGLSIGLNIERKRELPIT